MKRSLFVILAPLAIFILAACSTVATSAAVQLDPKLVFWVNAGMLVAVTAGLKYLGGLLGFDISEGAAVLASGLAAVFVMIINGLIGLLPATYDTWVIALQQFLIIVFSGNGLYIVFKKLRKGVKLVKL